ncbi:DNA-directed RNA polymerase subunit omega [Rickettsiales endosymbiont of Peranema trichophorum]|uniref:DNA-directed RNA polymerase subunit omega n=1 Tax=Rickettsiales endosymbiont of Peranema trichophorum TaxID=2486577 RepID=UPI001022E049|nr:DNA-directed RNA polymerase subunit omega [Rickettsiales endosymbiont of Peranema trichophorum]RZI47314.1 DNA-directed RNA polymerase subunit omega [Rickettsiales endosymbiont of Peranema trichophorum]
MARLTIEDCIKLVSNRFELVVLAAHRAKEMLSGAQSELSDTKDKETVKALKEIATLRIEVPKLRKSVIESYRNSGRSEDITELDAEDSAGDAEILEELSNYTVSKQDMDDMFMQDEDDDK